MYYMSCPATRASFASAAREMVLEPALGRNGFWTRLKGLAVPALFVWGERDRLVSASFAHQVALTRPEVPQLLMPCVSHWINGPHHRCLAEAMAVVVEELSEWPSAWVRPPGDDPYQRREMELEQEKFERSLTIKPSKLV